MVKTAIENRQNLIIEGCYIPCNWRRDFDEEYLSSIKFICLAMTEAYIDKHFDAINGYESEIESRMVDTDCSIGSLIEDNVSIIRGFQLAGEAVVLIEDNYEKTLERILDAPGFVG